jgi:hypothetical protein
MFEPRFGRSLSYVRLHDGPDAQALSRRIAARAVTHGADILFAPGQLNEVSTEGRRLLAHEITHTVQQGATTTLRRAPAPESDAPDLVQPHEVTMIVLENPTGARTNITYVNNEDGLFTFYRPIYPRDSIFIELESNFSDIEHVVGPIAVRFETEGQFERSDPGGPDPQLTLRVLAAPEEETEARLYLSAPNVAGEMEMVFNIGIVPLDIDPVQDLRLRKRAERRSLRRAQRDARRALRAERRADDDDRDLRAEMRALRRQQRTERQTFRKGRRQALSEAREERADEIEAARAAHGKHACTRSQRSNVSEAMGSAISRLDSALSHIRPSEPPDKYRMEKLEECFKIDPATASPAELTRIQTRAVDILNIARTSMLLSDPALVRCGAEPGECRPGAAAFVTDRVRGNPVTICQIWLDDNMIVEATKLEPGTERIYTLIHEFCHLAGVTDQSDEVYLHEKAWASLDSATAQTMAEAYAAFAWYMSSPGLE